MWRGSFGFRNTNLISKAVNHAIKIPSNKAPKIHLQNMASRGEDDFIDAAEELDINAHGGESGGQGRGNRGSRGNRRGGRGGSARGVENREVLVSKALSKLLRHAANEAGLTLDAEGFAPLDQVVSTIFLSITSTRCTDDDALTRILPRVSLLMLGLNAFELILIQMKWQRLKSLHVTFADIKTAVTDNAKQRFSMKTNPTLINPPDSSSEEPSDWVIRANQGHSIAVDSAALLVPITIESNNVPDIVVHGTYYGNYQSILDSGGLKKMSRNHIHFSTGLPEDGKSVISGMRNDAEILIYIDIRQSLEDGGVLWWLSENGVVLTEGDDQGVLSTKYWKKVEGRRQDVGVLWEDGVEVAELPQSVRNRKAPSGKGPRGKREGEKSKARDVAKGRGKAKDMKELTRDGDMASEA